MDIGFYLLNIDQGDYHANILNSINKLCEIRPYDNIVLFNDNYNTIDNNRKYYTLHISEAKYFKGFLFLFDIKSLMLTRTFPAPKKQILVANNLPWTTQQNVAYRFWHSLYMNKDLEIITENQDMYNLYANCWKNPIANILNLEAKDLSDVLQKL